MAQGNVIIFEARTDGVGSSMTQMTDLIRGGSNEWNKFGASAKGAMGGLEASAKRYKAEQVQEGRLLGFYTKELQAFIPMSNSAASAMGGVAQALMALSSGSLIGAGFEAMKVGISLMKEMGNDAKNSLRDLSSQVDAIISKAQAAKEGQAESMFLRETGQMPGVETETEQGDLYLEKKKALEQARNFEDREKVAYREIVAVWNLREKAGEQVLQGERDQLAARMQRAEDGRAIAQDELDRALGTLQRARDKMKSGLKTTEAGGSGPAVEWNAAGKSAEDSSASMAKAAKHDAGIYAKNFQLGIYQETHGVNSEGLGAAELQKRMADAAAAQDKKTAGLNTQMAGQSGMGGMQGASPSGETVADLKREADQLKKNQRGWDDYSKRVVGSLMAVAQGTKSWSAVLKSFLADAIKMMAEWAINAILKNAGVAAANTVAQNSSLGPWGWVKGLAEAAIVFAGVQAYTGMIGSAEGGADLPAFSGGRNFVLHSEEMVLPKSIANPLRRSLSQEGGLSGGGGVSVGNVTVVAPDGSDPEAFAKNIRRNRAQFTRELSESLREAAQLANLKFA